MLNHWGFGGCLLQQSVWFAPTRQILRPHIKKMSALPSFPAYPDIRCIPPRNLICPFITGGSASLDFCENCNKLPRARWGEMGRSYEGISSSSLSSSSANNSNATPGQQLGGVCADKLTRNHNPAPALRFWKPTEVVLNVQGLLCLIGKRPCRCSGSQLSVWGFYDQRSLLCLLNRIHFQGLRGIFPSFYLGQGSQGSTGCWVPRSWPEQSRKHSHYPTISKYRNVHYLPG